MGKSKETKKEKYEAPRCVVYELEYESVICGSAGTETGDGDDFIPGSSHGDGTNPWG